MKDQLYGIEIELTGISRKMTAEVLADYFEAQVKHIGGHYGTYEVEDNKGRNWKVMSDSSINEVRRVGSEDISNYQVEVVWS